MHNWRKRVSLIFCITSSSAIHVATIIHATHMNITLT
jgi:hypothetical protein